MSDDRLAAGRMYRSALVEAAIRRLELEAPDAGAAARLGRSAYVLVDVALRLPCTLVVDGRIAARFDVLNGAASAVDCSAPDAVDVGRFVVVDERDERDYWGVP